MCIHYFKASGTLELLRSSRIAHSTCTPRSFGGHWDGGGWHTYEAFSFFIQESASIVRHLSVKIFWEEWLHLKFTHIFFYNVRCKDEIQVSPIAIILPIQVGFLNIFCNNPKPVSSPEDDPHLIHSKFWPIFSCKNSCESWSLLIQPLLCWCDINLISSTFGFLRCELGSTHCAPQSPGEIYFVFWTV